MPLINPKQSGSLKPILASGLLSSKNRAVAEESGVTYSSWATTGSAFSSEAHTYLAPLNGTDIAVIQSGSTNTISTLRWGGSSFSQVGNALSMVSFGGVDAGDGLIKLSSTRVVFIEHGGETLYALEWDGTDWAQVGNTGSYSSLSGYSNGDYLSDNRFVIWGNDTSDEGFQVFDFDGTDFSAVGNKFTRAGNYSSIGALSATEIAIHDTAADEIAHYTFGGTNWTLTGSALSIGAQAGSFQPCGLSGTQALLFTATGVQTYKFDGANWATEGSASSLTGLSSWPRSCVKMSDTLIAYHSWGDQNIRAAEATLA